MGHYFGIGIEHPKTEFNIGTLWRSAHIFGASFIFTVGARYRKQSSDTLKAWQDIPLLNYSDFDDFYAHMPYSCRLVGIELDRRSVPIRGFLHPQRCVYLLGAEDHGLSRKALDACHMLVQLPGRSCLNVAAAGSCVMFDRLNKEA